MGVTTVVPSLVLCYIKVPAFRSAGANVMKMLMGDFERPAMENSSLVMASGCMRAEREGFEVKDFRTRKESDRSFRSKGVREDVAKP